MLSRDEIITAFRENHALLRGHFQLSSGRHSGHYLQCAQILKHPQVAEKLCREIAERFKRSKPTVVVGPATGGIIVAYETARAFGCRALYTERVDADMQLRRGFVIEKEDRVLVVEDTITTGESARKVAELVADYGARVVGFASIVDRSGGKVSFPGKRYYKLLSLSFESFAPEECPLCAESVPMTRPGRPKHLM
jgi:orotate phosphoribosyltransferase